MKVATTPAPQHLAQKRLCEHERVSQGHWGIAPRSISYCPGPASRWALTTLTQSCRAGRPPHSSPPSDPPSRRSIPRCRRDAGVVEQVELELGPDLEALGQLAGTGDDLRQCSTRIGQPRLAVTGRDRATARISPRPLRTWWVWLSSMSISKWRLRPCSASHRRDAGVDRALEPAGGQQHACEPPKTSTKIRRARPNAPWACPFTSPLGAQRRTDRSVSQRPHRMNASG